MKKLFLVILLLALYGCKEATPTLNVNDHIKQFLETYTSRFRSTGTDWGLYSSYILDDYELLNLYDISYPKDYHKKYDRQIYSVIMDDEMGLIMEFIPVIQAIYDNMNYENVINNIIQNVVVEELGPGYTTVSIEYVGENNIFLHYIYGNLIDEYLRLEISEDQSWILENYSISTTPQSASLGTYHYIIENVSSQTIEIYNENEYSMSFTNYITNDYFHYSNLDGEYYHLFTGDDMIKYRYEQGNEFIQMYNDHSNYFSYSKTGNDIEIMWQLLESRGWEYVTSDTLNLLGNVTGIYVDEKNIFDANTMRATSFIYADRMCAGLLLFQNFTEETITDEHLNLSRFGLNFIRNDYTVEEINSLMGNKLQYATSFMDDVLNNIGYTNPGFGQILADSYYARLVNVVDTSI